MTDDLRERVVALTDDHTRRHGPVRQHDLAIAVAAMVMEECEKACDELAIRYDGLESQASHRPFAQQMRGAVDAAKQCAAAIRQRAEGLR